MLKLTQKQNVGIWITAALATLTVGYALFVFRPRQKLIAAAQVELTQQQRYIVEATRLTAAIRHAHDHLAMARGQCEGWAKRAPDGGQLAHVYAEISKQAEQAEAVIASFDPQSPVKLNSIQQVPVQIGCRGDYHQLVKLISNLEKMPLTMWIDKLTITPGDAGGRTLRCDFTLTIFMKAADFSG